MNAKEQNFISAVVCVTDDGDATLAFFETLRRCLEERFEQYEFIAVNADSARNGAANLRRWAASLDKPLTLLNMSLRQSHEQCMNAGLDISIGDYVYEFDTVETPYPEDLIWEAYETAVSGSDIVAVCPRTERPMSRLFYRIFNAHSSAAYPLRTDCFRLTSRRAVNRVRAISETMPYRKAAYAACGLKTSVLEFDGGMSRVRQDRLSLAVDSLVLYTDFGYAFSVRLTLLMLLIALAELVYTVAVYLTGNPVSGWTTTMLVLTLGFTGLFGILAVVVKYLSLLLRLIFQKQGYLVESIEKL